MENKYLELIENNVNVSETNAIKEFFIMLAGLLLVLLGIVIFSDIATKIFIANMNVQTQKQIESYYKSNDKMLNKYIIDQNYKTELYQLNNIEKSIINNDNKLQNSNIEIHIFESNDVNAFVTPAGSIYITKALINELENNPEMLTFVLAHETGHYRNKHHLFAISRQLLISGITMLIFQDTEIHSFAKNINGMVNIEYSQRQEKDADAYANETLISLYGNNNAGIEFFKYINKKNNLPQFFHYFSTHPSPENRIKYLQNKKY